jgi:hypothetical protein
MACETLLRRRTDTEKLLYERTVGLRWLVANTLKRTRKEKFNAIR